MESFLTLASMPLGDTGYPVHLRHGSGTVPAGGGLPVRITKVVKGANMKLANLLSRFRKSESGASMVEYGVALLVVSAIGIGGAGLLGSAVGTTVTNATSAISGN